MMIFSGPGLLLVAPWLAAAVTFLLRRWPRLAVSVAVVAAWGLAALLRAVPLGEDAAGVTMFGRNLTLTAGVQALFLWLLLGLSLLFLLSLLFPPGRLFIPGSLAALSPLAAALMIRPFTFGALFLLVAVAILAVVVQAERIGPTRAAFRYLLVAVLAVPLLLVATWMLQTEQVGLLTATSRLLLVAFVVLLAGFPVHVWVAPIVDEAPALVSALIFGLVQLVVTFFAFDLLLAQPGLWQAAQFSQAIGWVGVVTVLVAAVSALTATGLGRLLGYLLLLDMGMALMTLALPGVDGWRTAVSLHLGRFLSLLLAGLGLRLLRRHLQSDRLTAYGGVARLAPLGSVLFAYGALSLIGLPLTVGFNGRWSLVVAVGQQAPTAWWPLLLLLAMAVATIAWGRGLARMLAVAEAARPGTGPAPLSRPLKAAAGLLLVVALLLTLAPWPVFAYAVYLASLVQ